MFNVRQISDDFYYVGGNDRRLELFENVYPVPDGVSYNSYLLVDDKTVLLDTADAAIAHQFLENLEHVLDGRTLDYVVVNHMEPDHCATLCDIVVRYPDVKIVGNTMTFRMMKQFFNFDVDQHAIVVKDGDLLSYRDGPIKEGYDFIGWSLSQNHKDFFDFETTITKDYNIYAYYEEKGPILNYYVVIFYD